MLNATIKIYHAADRDDRRDRDDPRFSVDQDSTLRKPDGEPVAIKVENFSSRGFRFNSRSCDLDVGTVVCVGLDGAGSQRAAVVWRSGSIYGCEFLTPVPRDRMAKAFTHARVARGRFARHGGHAQEPQVAKWPGSVRLALLLSGAIGSWALLYAAARFLLS
ncbi:PilZ domain-containing protein [Novosphingobium sp. BL-8H]|uniref:PilZ domain-containing protein n=1 Tax=Novosphingobium sp. BL-8H TaxID=3127640 RepID=UPI003756C96A